MDLRLGADVDAAGGLVHDQHPRLRGDPFGQDHLLLVSAGELPDRLLGSPGPDAEAGDRIRGQGSLPRAVDEKGPGDALEDRERQVLAHGLGPHQPLQSAILRHIGDPQAPRRRRAADGDRLAVDQDLARGRRRDAEDGEGKLGPSRADQPGDAENLARPQREAHVADRIAAGEAAQLEHGPARRGGGFREQAVDGAAHHHRDQIGFRHLADRPGPDLHAVAEHGHSVGQREDLRQPMADIDDADSAAAQAADHLEQPTRVGIGQGSGRLVHDDEPCVLRQRLGDLDPLPVGDREPAHGDIDIEVVAVERIQQRPRARPHRRPIHRVPAGAGRMADIDVLRNAELGKQQQLLVDGRDAVSGGFVRRGEADGRACDPHLPGIRRDHAGDDLDQRGFAGAVFAEQGVDLAGADIEADLLQHRHRAEGFGDARQLHEPAHAGRASRQLCR